MKEVKIQIPDNCELIKDGDSYAVREKKQNPPRNWEEFCEKYPLTAKERYISTDGIISPISSTSIGNKRGDKNWCTSEEEAEAFLALMQLRQLRKAWVGDWKQPMNSYYGVIYIAGDEFKVGSNYTIRRTLSFPTQEMAEDFLSCFKDLCETAKILL